MASGDHYKAIVDSVEPFLSHESTQAADVATVIKSLEARPPIGEMHDFLPVEDMEKRLVLAAKLQDIRWDDAGCYGNEESMEMSRMTAFDISALMLIPIDTIQKWVDLKSIAAREMEGTKDLVRACMSPHVFGVSHHFILTKVTCSVAEI